MDSLSSPARAWPFLVARGRRRGYRTLLAPDFLVAERDYGVLDDSVVPSTPEDQANVIEVVTRAGRRLTVVHATHQVTAADIAEPGTAPADHMPRDQHSRPLQLIYGFVCMDGQVPDPHPEDLRICRETALGSYRRFLNDEEGFTIAPGPRFLLQSRGTRRPFSAGPPPRTPAPATADRGDAITRSTPTLGNLLLLSAALLIAVILLAMWLTPSKPKPPCGAASPTGSPSAGRFPSQPPHSPTPTPTICPTPGQK